MSPQLNTYLEASSQAIPPHPPKLDTSLADHRRRKAASASELVSLWKAEGAYPFCGDALDVVEAARREVFDICALSVHQYLDSFRNGKPKDRQFTLRMLKTALDESPDSLKKILTEVLGLPKDKQTELVDLLQYTTLSSIIERARWLRIAFSFLRDCKSCCSCPRASGPRRSVCNCTAC